MPRTIGLITARGGSKGVPGKNVKILAGQPLIAWTIEAAKKASLVDRVVVSTDDQAIAEISVDWGAEVPFKRPAHLSTDDASHIAVIDHALQVLRDIFVERFDFLIVLQPTSPLRTANDIDASIRLALEKSANSVVGVCEVTQHPFLVKKKNTDGTLTSFIEHGLEYPQRQILPDAFFVNGAIYLIRIEAFCKCKSIYAHPCYPHMMPPERSLQIDTEWDFKLVELMSKTGIFNSPLG